MSGLARGIDTLCDRPLLFVDAGVLILGGIDHGLEAVTEVLQPSTSSNDRTAPPYDAPRELLHRARARRSSHLERILVRCFDLMGVLLLAAPAAAIIGVAALTIRCTSRGPIFFASQRHGQSDTTFGALKLRTMVDKSHHEVLLSAVPEGQAALDEGSKLLDDPRITRVGRILRRTSVDELPQLWNIVRGEMSLVGPRPKLLDERPLYGEAFDTILSVKPGLTGLWQTSGRNDLPFDARITLDLEHVATRSLLGDLFICSRTMLQVLSPRRHGAC